MIYNSGGIMPSKRKMIMVRATDEEQERIREIAEKEKRTISNLILWLVDQYPKLRSTPKEGRK